MAVYPRLSFRVFRTQEPDWHEAGIRREYGVERISDGDRARHEFLVIPLLFREVRIVFAVVATILIEHKSQVAPGNEERLVAVDATQERDLQAGVNPSSFLLLFTQGATDDRHRALRWPPIDSIGRGHRKQVIIHIDLGITEIDVLHQDVIGKGWIGDGESRATRYPR